MRVLPVTRHTPQDVVNAILEMSLDYLRRSGEELLPSEQEALIAASVSHQQGLATLYAVNDSGEPVAYALLRVVVSSAAVGPEVVVWQVYVRPGRARLKDLVDEGLQAIGAFAAGAGASRLVLHTRRVGRAYMRMLRSMGWKLYGVTMVREVQSDASRGS